MASNVYDSDNTRDNEQRKFQADSSGDVAVNVIDKDAIASLDSINSELVDVNTSLDAANATLTAIDNSLQPQGGQFSGSFSSSGVIVTGINCRDHESLTISISNVNQANITDVYGKVTGGTFEKIWTIVGVIDTRAIRVSKFDELEVRCSTFSSSGSGTLNLSVHDSDTFSETFENITLSQTISGVTYTATSKEPNAATSHPVWAISRRYVTGSTTVTQWANGGYYVSSYDNKVNLFPPAPLVNGLSIDMDGVDEFVSVPNHASINFTGAAPFSLSIWAKKSAGADGSLMSKVSAGLVGYLFNLGDTYADVFFVQSLFVAYIEKRFTFPSSAVGSWHNIVMTYNGSKLASGVKLYYDGVQITSTIVSKDNFTTTMSNTGALGIGGIPTFVGTNAFKGKLDEASIWNIELSAADVTEIYNLGKPTDLKIHSKYLTLASNLVSWWRMGDSATFPTIPDQVATNNGTMTNAEAADITADVP